MQSFQNHFKNQEASPKYSPHLLNINELLQSADSSQNQSSFTLYSNECNHTILNQINENKYLPDFSQVSIGSEQSLEDSSDSCEETNVFSQVFNEQIYNLKGKTIKKMFLRSLKRS